MSQDSHNQPPDESSEKKEDRIHSEEVKDRHTTHWDIDYLSTEELERAHREGRQQKNDGETSSESD